LDRVSGQPGGAQFPSRRRLADFAKTRGIDAISAGLDRSVFESGLFGARTLAAYPGRGAGSMCQLRRAAAQCAATAHASFPDAAATTRELPADWAAPAIRLPAPSLIFRQCCGGVPGRSFQQTMTKGPSRF